MGESLTCFALKEVVLSGSALGDGLTCFTHLIHFAPSIVAENLKYTENLTYRLLAGNKMFSVFSDEAIFQQPASVRPDGR